VKLARSLGLVVTGKILVVTGKILVATGRILVGYW
jgi:hypothetical protein